MRYPVCKTFKKLYKARKLTLSQLAESTNITEGSLERKLNGRSFLTAEEMGKLQETVASRIPTWEAFPEIYEFGKNSTLCKTST